MKKLTTTLLAILLFIGVSFGQTYDQLVTQESSIKFLAGVITESVSGVIITNETSDGVNLLNVMMPEYMVFDLMRSQVKGAVSQYSDVFLQQNWTYKTLDDGTVYYECVYVYGDYFLILNYHPSYNGLIMTYPTALTYYLMLSEK